MRVIAGLLGAMMLVGCGIPRDPESTLRRVSGGTIRVGVIDSPPWATFEDGEPSGIEIDLVRAFAEEIDADVEWFDGSESELLAALHVQELDLVVGGMDATSPYSKEAALTHTYVTTQTVVAFPAEEEIPEDIAGIEVGVEAGTEAAGLLEKTDAVPVRVDDVAAFSGPIVTENYHLDDLDVVDSGVQLKEVDHVMAAPLGENAFLVRLERFLLDDPGRVTARLEEAVP
ncbi:MAG: transporter substrate-binding domain-containing protein [Actinomycetota bacterium]